MTAPLHIVGTGAVTPAGLSAKATCAAIRAGISAYRADPSRREDAGPRLHAEVPLRPGAREGRPFGRLAAMAAVALQECIVAAELLPGRCALLLGVRETYRSVGVQGWREAELLRAIERISGLAFHPASAVSPSGNASALAALEQAEALLTSGAVETCIVGGVDSLLNPVDLQMFGRSSRIRCDGVPRGFVPGEGAAFVAVRSANARGSLAEVLGIGLSEEEASRTVLTDRESTGLGLGRAISAAILDAGIEESSIAFRVSDVNGEAYRSWETLLATSRAYRTRRESFPQILPAATVGEAGAAASALGLVAAATALSRGYGGGHVAVCESSSDGGLRAACVIKGGESAPHSRAHTA